MKPVSFSIYIPDGKKFHWTPNSIFAPLWLIPIFLVWIFEDYVAIGDPFHSYLVFYYGFLGLISIYYLIASYWRREPLYGVLKGEIIFKKDAIVINKEVYQLLGVSNLDFRFKNYYNMPSNSLQADFNPRLSQGVNNYVAFTDSKGHEHIIYFKLYVKYHYKELAPFLNEAIKAKKMEFKQGIDLVGIENISI